MALYPIVLATHNIVRWVVLLFGLFAVVRALTGMLNRRPWEPMDRRAASFFSISMDVQLLLGLLLYFVLSPITLAAFRDFGAAMAESGARFFAVEHLAVMVLSVVFAHLGSILPRRAAKAGKGGNPHRAALIWNGLAVLLILAGMPWMRPLLPGLG